MFVKDRETTLSECGTSHVGDTNYPLIITGDEGCGKTHTIIKWLNQRYHQEDCQSEQSGNESSNSSGSVCGSKVQSNDEEGANDSQIDPSEGSHKNKHKKHKHPNIQRNGDVLLTFFAGIETITSRVQLKSLIPQVNKTTIKKAGIQNKYGDMNKDENSSDDDDVQLGKQDNSSSKY